MKIYVGDRFYKEFSDDDKEDFRIVKIKNENTFRIKYTNGELDTITRDVEISISINKPLEYWLHHSMTNM